MDTFAVVAEGLRKRYGDTHALDGFGLAVGFILAPRVLFLDEPTTGLDPRNRNEVWKAIRALVAGGTTVLLTTQYLDEADKLADQIALIDTGRVIAEGRPAHLKSLIGGDQIDLVLPDPRDLTEAAGILARITTAEPAVDPDIRAVHVPAPGGIDDLTDVVRALHTASIAIEDIALRRPTLDEVFLRLTDREVAA